MDSEKVPSTRKALERLVQAVRGSRTIAALDGLGEAGQADEVTFAVEAGVAAIKRDRERQAERTARSRARRAEELGIPTKLDGNGDVPHYETDGISTWDAATGAPVEDDGPGGPRGHLGAGASVEAYRG